MTISFTKSKNNQKINTSSKYYGSSNPFHGYAPTCTWYAYGRYYEVQKGSIPSCGKSGINGNGGAFYGFAKAQGKRKTGKTPKLVPLYVGQEVENIQDKAPLDMLPL